LGLTALRFKSSVRPALLERQGQRLYDADLFIGAIAVAQNAAVVTRNRRHYERIPGLTIETWIPS
jgi:tRNA(fMet)-specific endonuclease VapC